MRGGGRPCQGDWQGNTGRAEVGRPLPTFGRRAKRRATPSARAGRKRRMRFRQAQARVAGPPQSRDRDEWPTRHDGPKTIKITFTKNQRDSRADRPEPPKRPPEEATAKHFNFLDKDQAADPSSFRTILGPAADDLDPVLSDRGPDDPQSSRTIPMRSSVQSSSGSSPQETKENSMSKDDEGPPDDSCGPLSNCGSTYSDEPPQDDGEDDDDWRDGGSGIL